MIRKNPGVLGVSMFAVLLAISLTACEDGDEGGNGNEGSSVGIWLSFTTPRGNMQKQNHSIDARWKSWKKRMAKTVHFWCQHC